MLTDLVSSWDNILRGSERERGQLLRVPRPSLSLSYANQTSVIHFEKQSSFLSHKRMIQKTNYNNKRLNIIFNSMIEVQLGTI